MKLEHFARHYCPLHPDFLQPDEGGCRRCGGPLAHDPTLSGALEQAVGRPGMLYFIIAVMCALMLAIALLVR